MRVLFHTAASGKNLVHPLGFVGIDELGSQSLQMLNPLRFFMESVIAYGGSCTAAIAWRISAICTLSNPSLNLKSRDNGLQMSKLQHPKSKRSRPF